MPNQNNAVCKILAHRGANRYAPENTRPAFDKAFEYAVDGVETDVQLSKDGVPVLWHDAFLDKLGLNKQRIDDFDFQQLQAMRFAQTPTAIGLMGLAEFLARYRGRGVLNVEVKCRAGESELRQQAKIRYTLDLIGSAGVEDIFVSSFHLQSLIYAHAYSQKIPLFYLLTERQTGDAIVQALQQQPFLAGFCLTIGLIDETLTSLLRGHNKGIVVYTCNSEAEIRKALQLQVEMLITDDPLQALRLRSENWGGRR